jgi:putative transferase
MENLVIVGIGKSADFIYEFVRRHNLYKVIGFAVNRSYLEGANTSFKDLPVYALESLRHDLGNVKFKVFVALMWNRLNSDRRKVFEYCESEGFELASLISPNSVIMLNASIGKNCYVGDFTIINSGGRVDDDCILVGANVVGAYSLVQKHVFMAFQSVTGGYVRIGTQSFIGMHATVNEHTVVGDKCIIGSGVTIRRNVPPYTSVSMTDASLNMRTYAKETIENKLRADIVPR